MNEIDAKLCQIDELRKIMDEDRANIMNIKLNSDRITFQLNTDFKRLEAAFLRQSEEVRISILSTQNLGKEYCKV